MIEVIRSQHLNKNIMALNLGSIPNLIKSSKIGTSILTTDLVRFLPMILNKKEVKQYEKKKELFT